MSLGIIPDGFCFISVISFLVIFWIVLKKVLRHLLHNLPSKKLPSKVLKGDISKKIFIITGSSSGIGKGLAGRLAKMGGNIIFACRNERKTKKVIEEIKRSIKNNKQSPILEFMELNLSRLSSVREFTNKILNRKFPYEIILINNAGCIGDPKLTKDGIDETFQVNYLGPFLLSNLLIYEIERTGGRIINVSSSSNRWAKKEDLTKSPLHKKALKNDSGLHGGIRYPRSKLALNIFTNHFNKVLTHEGVNVPIVSCCPGMVMTMLISTNIPWYVSIILFFIDFLIKNVEEGCRTPLFLSLVERKEFEKWSGELVFGFQVSRDKNNSLAFDIPMQNWLWKKTEEILDQEFFIKNEEIKNEV